MAWHKPGPVIDDAASFFEEQVCQVCGARRQRRKGSAPNKPVWNGAFTVRRTRAPTWSSWYRKGTGPVTRGCPGPLKVIDAIIVSERQRPGLIIDEGGRP